jgi:UDP-glucose 4-epimerase
MKALIIGSKGFIGTHLTRYFEADAKNEVYTCDVVTDYAAKNYFLIDAANADFEEVFKDREFDVCLNCSGAASVPDSVIHPLRDYYLNAKHVFNILNAIRQFSPATKFINLSSAAVYGNPTQLPIRESQPVSPVSPYGWHKYHSELICREFSDIYKLKTCSVRVFSVYGPGLKKQLFWDWAQKAEKMSELLIFGTGNESRDFIYIDDLVKALALIGRHAAFQAETINVANGEEVFIKDAATTFTGLLERPLPIRFNNEVRKGDPLNWVADITLLRSFGYQQKLSFKEGIQRYLEWIKGLE